MHHVRSSFRPTPSRSARCVLLLFSALAWSWGASLQAASPRVVITPAAGYTITWDGNNGGFSSPEADAGPADNVALATHGTVAFGSTELDFGVHFFRNVNDGRYGNSSSWIANFTIPDPAPFIGLRFASTVEITSIAWGRDNGNTTESACGGTCTDRAVGAYTLQYTAVSSPDASTEETGDAATGWISIGTIEYLPGADDVNFTAHLRHRFEVAHGGQAIAATGIRIKVSSSTMAIDELEVNPLPDPVPPIGSFIEITPEAGYAIAWDRNEGIFSTDASPAPAPVNAASASQGAVAFGSSELDFGVHFIRNVNDGFYGNRFSWIPDFAGSPDPAPFIGIRFPGRILLRNFAWGRDNGDVAGDCCGGTLKDRVFGVYTIQVTTAPNPDASTPEACGPNPDSGWVTIGAIHYKADHPTLFNAYLRHRFDVSRAGHSIPATGIRIKVPNNQIAIDEIEVNTNLAIENEAVRIVRAGGHAIVWDGNNGHFEDPAIGAAPPPNRALAAEGTVAFTSSDLGPVLSIPFHVAANLNDGLYGNANSWISANGIGGSSDPDPFAGLNFNGLVAITNIAWGRDNGNVAGDCCGGTLTDRSLGSYRLQFTTVTSPDASTLDTGDAGTGWEDIGTVTYASAAPPFFHPHLRHRFDVAAADGGAIQATGIRIKVSSGAMAIDEIEVNTATSAPPPPGPVGLNPAPGFSITWDGNNGHFFNPDPGAAPPPNRALASQGTTPFGSSELGETLGLSFHRFVNINDGLYGNSFSWISANGIGGSSDPDPFVGLNFNGTVEISNVAWSRDNGDNAEFIGTDRALGTYTIQITTVATPDATTPETGEASTGWVTVGTVEYRRAEPPDFTPHLRHRFDLAADGAPIEATGLRIKVSNGQIAIDEIEVNTAIAPPAPHLSVTRSGLNVVITWTGGGGLEMAADVNGPWTCLPDAVSPFTTSLDSEPARYFRIRR
jgi:hypothetical protein